ncbi:hypothetical protein ACRWQL_01110 [Shewanella sp. HL-SH4]|uniref:hypothetical protein n=1 Tax=Shewanella sp. HL-SH4 TaxID=3436240 RepID=UPI003EBD1973
MKKTFFVTGFQSAKGVGKSSGKSYEFASLFNLSPVRNWETEKGRSESKGFTIDDDKCLKADISLVRQLSQYEYPCFISAEIDIDPEDMTSTILVEVFGHTPLDMNVPLDNKPKGTLSAGS